MCSYLNTKLQFFFWMWHCIFIFNIIYLQPHLFHIRWIIIMGALICKCSTYLPEVLLNDVIISSQFHPKFSQFTALRTAELFSRVIYLPQLETMVLMYIARCKICHWIAALHHIQSAVNLVMHLLNNHYNRIIITWTFTLLDPPKSKYTGVLVRSIQLSMLAICQFGQKDIN